MNRILRYFLLYGLIFLAIMGIFSSLNNTNPKTKEIDLRRIRHSFDRWKSERIYTAARSAGL